MTEIKMEKKIETINPDMKLIMETLTDIIPKNHKNYEKIAERAQAPVQLPVQMSVQAPAKK